jgi:hypothetical protein
MKIYQSIMTFFFQLPGVPAGRRLFLVEGLVLICKEGKGCEAEVAMAGEASALGGFMNRE